MINDVFVASRVGAGDMDLLWAAGWRHFGVYFFRYSIAEHRGAPCHVIPLRLEVATFVPSRSQRRVLNTNRDLQVVIRDTVIDPAKEALFDLCPGGTELMATAHPMSHKGRSVNLTPSNVAYRRCTYSDGDVTATGGLTK